jgi:hypothetical protein
MRIFVAARLHQRQGLHLHVAAFDRHDAVKDGKADQAIAGLRDGRHGDVAPYGGDWFHAHFGVSMNRCA